MATSTSPVTLADRRRRAPAARRADAGAAHGAPRRARAHRGRDRRGHAPGPVERVDPPRPPARGGPRARPQGRRLHVLRPQRGRDARRRRASCGSWSRARCATPSSEDDRTRRREGRPCPRARCRLARRRGGRDGPALVARPHVGVARARHGRPGPAGRRRRRRLGRRLGGAAARAARPQLDVRRPQRAPALAPPARRLGKLRAGVASSRPMRGAFPFRDASFDAALLLHVLAQVESPARVLRRGVARAAPRGARSSSSRWTRTTTPTSRPPTATCTPVSPPRPCAACSRAPVWRSTSARSPAATSAPHRFRVVTAFATKPPGTDQSMNDTAAILRELLEPPHPRPRRRDGHASSSAAASPRPTSAARASSGTRQTSRATSTSWRSRGRTSSASIHDAYFEAGADLVETNTFGATSIVQAEYGLRGPRVRDQRRRDAYRQGERRASGRSGRRTSRASSRARSGRSTRRSRSRRASPTRASAPSPSTRCATRTPSRCAALIEGGVGPAARRDDLRHAQRQGRARRHRGRLRGDGRAAAGR